MDKAYKTYNVSSFREFQDIILDIPTDHFILYRGQAQDKALLPKIARYRLKDAEETEREMLEDFQRRSLHLIDYHPGNSWDWLALAQHHGMATRLLDWTENSLIALWFSMATKDEMGVEYSVVWGFKVPKEDIVNSTEDKDPFKGGMTKVFTCPLSPLENCAAASNRFAIVVMSVKPGIWKTGWQKSFSITKIIFWKSTKIAAVFRSA